MFIYTFKFDRKKVLFVAVMVALVILGIILIATAHPLSAKADKSLDLSTEDGRVSYLAGCGLTVESPAESTSDILIPREFSKVYTKYNELQLSQGFDLRAYAGEKATVYTYRVKDWPDEHEVVYAQLYISGNQVIGGDVHSTELDGFIKGLKQ